MKVIAEHYDLIAYNCDSFHVAILALINAFLKSPRSAFLRPSVFGSWRVPVVRILVPP